MSSDDIKPDDPAKLGAAPGIWVNKFIASVEGEITRILFADQAGEAGDVVPRGGLVMRTADAEALASMLSQLIEQNRARRASPGGKPN